MLAAVLLALTMFPAVVLAAPGVAEISFGTPEGGVPAGGYEPGDTFTIPVVLADNPGFTGLAISTSFDHDVLEFVSFDTTGSDCILTTANGWLGYENPNDTVENGVAISRMNVTFLLTSTNFMGNGTLYKLTFKVKDDAAPGATALTHRSRLDAPTNFADYLSQAVPVNYTGTSITVKDMNPQPVAPAGIVVGSPAAALNPGDSFTVPVSIQDNPGFAAAAFTLDFDDSALELTALDATGALFDGKMLTDLSVASVGYVDPSLNLLTGDGILFNATFTVKSAATTGPYTIGIGLRDGQAMNFVDDMAAPLAVEFTAGELAIEAGYTQTTIVVGSASGEPGEQVVVPVSIVLNPGFSTTILKFDFDSDILEPDSVDLTGGLLDGQNYFIWHPVAPDPNDRIIISNISGNITGDGLLFNLVFNIKADAADGDTAVSVRLMNDNPANLINHQYDELPVDFSPGNIEVELVLTPDENDLDYDVSDWVRVYNGSPQTVSVTPNPGIGAVTVYYGGSATAPTNVGTYEISVDIAASPGYRAVTGLVLGDLVINKAPAPDISGVTASDITYGQSLADSAFTPPTSSYGSYQWTDDSITPAVPGGNYQVTFTPNANTILNYEAINPLTLDVHVTVNKAPAPVISSWPTSSSVIEGDALSTSTLSPASNSYGSFEWTDSSIVPAWSGGDYQVTFVPSADTLQNYEPIAVTTHDVHVTVVRLGDINGDGNFTSIDLLKILQAANGLITLTGDEFLAADINRDDSITSVDAMLLARLTLGI
jgi:hypothetical protein